jgi:hypothetical protein
MNRRPYNSAIPSAPARRTPRAHGAAAAASIAVGGMSAKRCRFGRGPGFVEGIDV